MSPVSSGAYPVDLLFVTAALDQLLIIAVVVLLLEGGQPVEAVDQQALALEVGESERAADGVDPAFPRPVLGGREEGRRDILIVNRIEAGESGAAPAGLFVVRALDDRRYPSGGLSVLFGEEVSGLAGVVVDVIL